MAHFHFCRVFRSEALFETEHIFKVKNWLKMLAELEVQTFEYQLILFLKLRCRILNTTTPTLRWNLVWYQTLMSFYKNMFFLNVLFRRIPPNPGRRGGLLQKTSFLLSTVIATINQFNWYTCQSENGEIESDIRKRQLHGASHNTDKAPRGRHHCSHPSHHHLPGLKKIFGGDHRLPRPPWFRLPQVFPEMRRKTQPAWSHSHTGHNNAECC